MLTNTPYTALLILASLVTRGHQVESPMMSRITHKTFNRANAQQLARELSSGDIAKRAIALILLDEAVQTNVLPAKEERHMIWKAAPSGSGWFRSILAFSYWYALRGPGHYRLPNQVSGYGKFKELRDHFWPSTRYNAEERLYVEKHVDSELPWAGMVLISKERLDPRDRKWAHAMLLRSSRRGSAIEREYWLFIRHTTSEVRGS